MARGRTARTFNDRMVNNAVKMIAAHVGRPCPTRREVMEWTGVQRRHVWTFLQSMADLGTIEMEVRDPDPTRPEMPRRRRLRVTGGMWTDWTARFRHRNAPRPALLQLMNGWGSDAGA